MKTDAVYIANILDCIEKIETFTTGVTMEDFFGNQMMQSATILQLGLIGEEANKIGADTKARIDLAWKEIVAFRNTAFHEYLNLELKIIWDTLHEDIPNLKAKLLAYQNESPAV